VYHLKQKCNNKIIFKLVIKYEINTFLYNIPSICILFRIHRGGFRAL